MLQCKPPHNIRLITFNMLGLPAMLATADNHTLTVSLLSEDKHFSGYSHPEHLAKIFGMYVAVDDIIGILHGKPTVDVLDAQCCQEGFQYRCDLMTPQGPCSLWIDPDEHTITRYHAAPSPAMSYDILFEDFRRINGSALPFRISMQNQYERIKVTVSYSSVSFAPLDNETFHHLPRSSHILPLDMLPQLW
ncbi:MAG: DUF4292 domain-containing protein [Desulfobacterota bacterium]|nr:DUF4292 domain-containing protein [Thermodesulfobacteriota bacterium]